MADLPEYLIDKYKLCKKVTKYGYVYVEGWKEMYGFHHSWLIAHHLLEERLHKHGYHQIKHTPVFWTHVFSPVYIFFGS